MQPGARKTAIGGLVTRADGGVALKIWVTAAPEAGKANAALIALVAAHFGVRKAQVSIRSGAAARLKRVQLED